jgi:hypothetical protein
MDKKLGGNSLGARAFWKQQSAGKAIAEPAENYVIRTPSLCVLRAPAMKRCGCVRLRFQLRV